MPKMGLQQKKMWLCESCGRQFANANQSHACGTHDLAHHFAGKSPQVRDVYAAFIEALQIIGPVIVLPEKTRIAFQVRMSFAQLTTRIHWIDGHLVLARRIEHHRFRKVETISRRNHVHHFRLHSPSDLDAEFCAWLEEAYAVGGQEHLGSVAAHGDGRSKQKDQS